MLFFFTCCSRSSFFCAKTGLTVTATSAAGMGAQSLPSTIGFSCRLQSTFFTDPSHWSFPLFLLFPKCPLFFLACDLNLQTRTHCCNKSPLPFCRVFRTKAFARKWFVWFVCFCGPSYSILTALTFLSQLQLWLSDSSLAILSPKPSLGFSGADALVAGPRHFTCRVHCWCCCCCSRCRCRV